MEAAFSIVGNPEHEADDRSVATSRADAQRVVDALHAVERAAGRPGPGREQEWIADLRVAVEGLDKALDVYHYHASSSDGLLPALARRHAAIRPGVEQLHDRHAGVQAELRGVKRHLDDLPSDTAVE
ncbi:MAG TPA: hypothetical protein VFC99_19440 [Acidimicrobiia bacterium]|nr:hypothetical protein [Acidimicrobiia bacterium]